MKNRTGERLSLLGAAVLIALAVPAAAAAPAGFHPPKSPAEVALDKVLKAADADEFQLDNLLHRYPVVPKKRVDYRTMLSAALIAAMQAEEKKLVAHDCGGKYLEGEVCGMDSSPITCAQDVVTPYMYKTIDQKGAAATIAGPSATYHMMQTHTGWQIDGIKCNEGSAFNFK